ncbi:MAG: hypothetical protein ACOH5I_07115 [Oligoflexus sp.]
MKRSICLLLGALFFSFQAQAASYQLPTDDPIQAKVAKFPLEGFEAGVRPGVISYSLPEMLTGKPVRIEMKLVNDTGDRREYNAANVSGECTGPVNRPLCEVRFRNLGLDNAGAEKRRQDIANRVYADPSLRTAVLELGNRFAAEDEPIGIIDAREDLSMPKLTGKWWASRYQAYGSNNRVANKLCFYWKSTTKLWGEYRVGNRTACMNAPCGSCPSSCDLCGELSDLETYGQHMSGKWTVAGYPSGWIDLSFDQWGKFEGTYGMSYRLDENQEPAAGRWWGQ